MRIHHFTLLFVIFFIALVIKTDLAVGHLKSLRNEKSELNTALNTAVSDAIHYLAASGAHGANTINKDEVVATLFRSLYSSMGIISDANAQAELEMYIPIILLCDSDGYYIYYYDDYRSSDGYTYSERLWSEKMPYFFQDDNFIYNFTLTDLVSIYDKNRILNANQELLILDYHEIQTAEQYSPFRTANAESFLLDGEKYKLAQKGALISLLEDVMTYYTGRHNSIARRNGITYSFSFPAGQEKEWADYLDDVNLLAVFQGYPYGEDNNYTFNKVTSAGASIIKKPVYYVEQKSWYLLAHLKGCEKLAQSTAVLEDVFDSVDECAKIGAYCCECIEHGARVPEIN